MVFYPLADLRPHIAEGKLRGLRGRQRGPASPTCPTCPPWPRPFRISISTSGTRWSRRPRRHGRDRGEALGGNRRALQDPATATRLRDLSVITIGSSPAEQPRSSRGNRPLARGRRDDRRQGGVKKQMNRRLSSLARCCTMTGRRDIVQSPRPPLRPRKSSYPSRLIKIVVPVPPGAFADTLPRLIGEARRAVGPVVIIGDRPGAASNLGARSRRRRRRPTATPCSPRRPDRWWSIRASTPSSRSIRRRSFR